MGVSTNSSKSKTTRPRWERHGRFPPLPRRTMIHRSTRSTSSTRRCRMLTRTTAPSPARSATPSICQRIPLLCPCAISRASSCRRKDVQHRPPTVAASGYRTRAIGSSVIFGPLGKAIAKNLDTRRSLVSVSLSGMCRERGGARPSSRRPPRDPASVTQSRARSRSYWSRVRLGSPSLVLLPAEISSNRRPQTRVQIALVPHRLVEHRLKLQERQGDRARSPAP